MNWNTVISLATTDLQEPLKRVEKTEEEWSKKLSSEQFRITRKHGTEPAFSGEHCESHQSGKYGCVCCNTVLFDSSIKFDSGSGWPSFTAPTTDNVIKYIKDSSFGMVRVEVLCKTCDAHLGHVFPDGPAPTGLRFCINSLAILLMK